MDISKRTRAEQYALIVGLTLVVAGIMGFFWEPKFTDDKSVRDGVLGILDVNGWHNVVHLATGLLGLAAFAAGAAACRQYAYGLGVVYIAVAIWGFIIGDGDSILSIIPVNTEDNFLHLLIGLVGLGAGAASTATPAQARRDADAQPAGGPHPVT
jgi:hypothetical protein